MTMVKNSIKKNAPYKVNILASENALFSTVFGPFDMFLQAGVFWNTIMGESAAPYFDIKISAITNERIHGPGGTSLIPHRKIQNRDKLDLIIVPSEGMHIDTDSDSFKQRVSYLKRMHDKGTVIASICTGTFLLAEAGLLDDKVATTHWAMAEQFCQLYPAVNLNTDLLIAEHESVVTAGGVSADQDLCMHLIKRFCGTEVALQTARCTLVPFTDRQQMSFKTFVVNKHHGDEEILACQEMIESDIQEELSVNDLADRFYMSTRSMNRRFKQATGHTLNSYIQQLKVEKAKSILEREPVSFDEVSFRLGYTNVSFFRRLFKQYVGLTPKAYRQLLACY